MECEYNPKGEDSTLVCECGSVFHESKGVLIKDNNFKGAFDLTCPNCSSRHFKIKGNHEKN